MLKRRVVLTRSNPVNPNPAVERVASALVEAGCEVTVLGWDRSEKYTAKEDVLKLPSGTARIIRFGIPAVYSGGLKKNLLPLVTFQKRLSDWFRIHKNEYDSIHAFDFDTGYTAMSAAKKYGKGLVYQIQDFYAADRFAEGSKGYDFLKNLEFSVINYADAAVICTEARKKQIDGSKPRRLEIIHNTPGYSVPASDDNFEVSADKVKIAYVGCFEDHRFLKEMLSIVMNDSRFELHMGGFGLYEEYVRECSEACDRVHFYGKLPYGQVLALEKKCDVLTAMYDPAIPNNRFAAPNKLYESMMLAKPVIMCQNTGWDDVVEGNRIGVIAHPSEEGIKEALEKLVEAKDSWQEMGQRGNLLYNKSYSWEIMNERIKRLYQELYHGEP